MRKYKRKGLNKIGGAAPAPQSVPQPTTQTISGSISNTYGYTKNTIKIISNYITENFIFVLIAGILIIFYLYLLSTDPVTQEDLDASVVAIKCDSFTDICPQGKKINSNIECVNNECTKDTCCINEVDCSSYSSTSCPTSTPSVNYENTCETETCTQDDCCVKNCEDFTQCRDRFILNPDNLCEGEQCTTTECCEEKRTCFSSNENNEQFNCSILDKVQKSSPNGIECPVEGCNDVTCCRESESTNPSCESWDCNDKRNKASADNLLCSEGEDGNCSHDYCCKL
jgi:hypothetical protein